MSAKEIYIAIGEDGYEYCHPVNPEGFEAINMAVDGKPKVNRWNPVPVEIIRWEKQRKLRHSDSPWLGDHALIFGDEAVTSMGEVLGKAGELLPLACRDTHVFLFNPLHALPALDEQASSLFRFDNGSAMMVRRYIFINDLVKDIDAFKLTNLRISPTFLSKRIVDAWKDRGLAGLNFIQVT